MHTSSSPKKFNLQYFGDTEGASFPPSNVTCGRIPILGFMTPAARLQDVARTMRRLLYQYSSMPAPKPYMSLSLNSLKGVI